MVIYELKFEEFVQAKVGNIRKTACESSMHKKLYINIYSSSSFSSSFLFNEDKRQEPHLQLLDHVQCVIIISPKHIQSIPMWLSPKNKTVTFFYVCSYFCRKCQKFSIAKIYILIANDLVLFCVMFCVDIDRAVIGIAPPTFFFKKYYYINRY